MTAHLGWNIQQEIYTNELNIIMNFMRTAVLAIVLFIVATCVFGAFVLNNFIPVSLLNIVCRKRKTYYAFCRRETYVISEVMPSK